MEDSLLAQDDHHPTADEIILANCDHNSVEDDLAVRVEEDEDISLSSLCSQHS